MLNAGKMKKTKIRHPSTVNPDKQGSYSSSRTNNQYAYSMVIIYSLVITPVRIL